MGGPNNMHLPSMGMSSSSTTHMNNIHLGMGGGGGSGGGYKPPMSGHRHLPPHHSHVSSYLGMEESMGMMQGQGQGQGLRHYNQEGGSYNHHHHHGRDGLGNNNNNNNNNNHHHHNNQHHHPGGQGQGLGHMGGGINSREGGGYNSLPPPSPHMTAGRQGLGSRSVTGYPLQHQSSSLQNHPNNNNHLNNHHHTNQLGYGGSGGSNHASHPTLKSLNESALNNPLNSALTLTERALTMGEAAAQLLRHSRSGGNVGMEGVDMRGGVDIRGGGDMRSGVDMRGGGDMRSEGEGRVQEEEEEVEVCQ